MGEIALLSLVVPLADVTPQQRQHIIRGTLQKVHQEAEQTQVLKNVKLAARALAGNDLGLAGHGWNETVSRTAGTANTYEDSLINGTTARDRVIGIYGVYIASYVDSVSGLRFRVGGQRTHQWDLQSVLADEPWRASRENRTLVCYVAENGDFDPIIIPALSGILVQHYIRSGTQVGIQPAELVFLGVVLEPIGGGGGGLVVEE